VTNPIVWSRRLSDPLWPEQWDLSACCRPVGRVTLTAMATGFITGWMDTARAQEVLSFQRHSLPEMLAETRDEVGWRRWPRWAAAPAMRAYLGSRSPYRRRAGVYGDPWGAICGKWGDPSPA
jgi:hypothetical protein